MQNYVEISWLDFGLELIEITVEFESRQNVVYRMSHN